MTRPGARRVALGWFVSLALASCEATPPRDVAPRARAAAEAPPTDVPDEPAPAAPADDVRAEEPIAAPGPAPCTAGAPVDIGSWPARAIAVAASETHRVVVLDPSGGGFVVLAPESDAPDAPVARREIPRARDESIFALEATGERFLLVGRAPCTNAGLATECLVARSITVGDDIATSLPVEVALPSRIRTMRVFASRTLVYVARSHAEGPPGLERFEVRDDGTVVHVRRTMGEAIPADEPVEILGMTADGAGWAVLYRHGATEDAGSAVVLATQLDEHEVSELHDALLVESMAWVGTSLALIVAFEFARPSWVRLAADGEVETPPRALPPRGEAPLPFTGRRTARIVGHARSRALEIRDALGDRVGSRLLLGPGTADVSRVSGGFIVALLEDERAVSLRTIACP